MEKQPRRTRLLIPSPRPRSQAPSLPSPARSSSQQLTLAAAAAAAAADAGAPLSIQTSRGMAQDQQQPWGAAAPALLVPLPARRVLGPDDLRKAFDVVKKDWIPIRERVPPVEDTYFKYKKETDGTGDEDANLVKRQVINSCNSLGNKRREIYYYLPSKKKYEALITRLSNELQGLEHQLGHRIADFRTFMPDNPFEMPDHFTRYPELMKPVSKKVKATKRK